MKIRSSYPVVWMLVVFLLSACDHKELCEHRPHMSKIRVQFDWRDAPDATVGGMCVWFYPLKKETRPSRYDFQGMEGREVELETGTSRIICHNNDSEVDLCRNSEDFSSHLVYTRDGNIFEPIYGNVSIPTPRSIEDEHVAICPEMLYGCHAVDVEITESGMRYIHDPDGSSTKAESDEQVIVLYPHEEVCTYTYEIRNVQNLSSATQMCGSLSGMAHGLYLGTEELEHDCVTIPFEAHSDGVSNVTGKFYTYGHCEKHDIHAVFNLYVWMKDGKKYYYSFDVTDQIEHAPDKRHVHILIDGLEFPLPIENGSGFEVGADDWGNVYEDIVM